MGKPTGNDIREKKITMPLLHVLDQSDEKERRRILRELKKKHKGQEKVQELVKLVVDRGGLDYASEQMNVYRDRAIAKIKAFPETEARASLIELVNYVTTRKK